MEELCIHIQIMSAGYQQLYRMFRDYSFCKAYTLAR